MEKVAGINYYPMINSPSAAAVASGGTSLLERSQAVRGHHSSVNKAVDAHRLMVEERQLRNFRRDPSMMGSQGSTDLMLAQQMSSEDSTNGDGGDYSTYENTLIEAPSTQAKMASIQSFQTTEPDRPSMGEPVPKGSYLDVEA